MCQALESRPRQEPGLTVTAPAWPQGLSEPSRYHRPGETLTDRLGRPSLQRGGSALLPHQGVLASVKALPGLATHLQVGLRRCEQTRQLVPAPLMMGTKLDWFYGDRSPCFSAPAMPCEQAARASWQEGDGVIPKALPVFRSGKCSGGSREVLGTGGRKVLSTGGEGPSGSRGSRDLQGEATLLETFPSWWPRATHATPSNIRVAHGASPLPGA